MKETIKKIRYHWLKAREPDINYIFYKALISEDEKKLTHLVHKGFDLEAVLNHKKIQAMNFTDAHLNAIQIACTHNLGKSIDFLLSHKVNIESRESRDHRGQTPLHLLCGHQGEQPVLDNLKKLVSRGANIHNADEYGNYPLYDVIGNKNTESASYLLSLGANPYLYLKYENALEKLIRYSHYQIVENIIDNIKTKEDLEEFKKVTNNMEKKLFKDIYQKFEEQNFNDKLIKLDRKLNLESLLPEKDVTPKKRKI